jgi:cell division protein FtsN
MLAGSPATLNVTALKREDPEPEAAPEAPAEPLIAADTISTAPIDGADPAALAEAPAEPERKGLFGKRKPKPADPAAEMAAADLPVDPAAAPTEGAALAAETTAAIAAAPERKGLFGKRKPEAAEPGIVSASIETASLDAAAPLAEPAAEPIEPAKPARKGLFARRDRTPEATGAPLSAISAPVEVAAVMPTAKPAAKPAAKSSGGKDYIQIGIFSVEGNAENTATALRRDGMVPTVKVSSASGKTYWRVVVGPAGTTADRAARVRTVKALGVADADLVGG